MSICREAPVTGALTQADVTVPRVFRFYTQEAAAGGERGGEDIRRANLPPSPDILTLSRVRVLSPWKLGER